jgi:hypothetical protein
MSFRELLASRSATLYADFVLPHLSEDTRLLDCGCDDPWYATRSVAHGLLTQAQLRRTRDAWEEWSRSPESFLAFAWIRAIGRRPAR